VRAAAVPRSPRRPRDASHSAPSIQTLRRTDCLEDRVTSFTFLVWDQDTTFVTAFDAAFTFDDLHLDREDDLATKVTGQSYTEPVHDLMAAAQAHGSTNQNRLTANGEPVSAWVTLAGPLDPVFLDGGSSRTAMVELRGFEPLAPSMRTRFGPSESGR
jgi:hypothetical protein